MRTSTVRRIAAAAISGVLLAPLAQANGTALAHANRAAADEPRPLGLTAVPARAASLPVGRVVARGLPPDPAAAAALRKAPDVSWPSPGSARVDLGSTAVQRERAPVRAGAMPVWVSPAEGTAIGAATAGPSAVDVQLLSRAAAARARVSGLLLRLGRADGRTAAGRVRLELDYSDFRHAYGGDWSRRLRLIALPACALSTPDKPGCQEGRPVASSNRTVAGRLTAQVDLPGAGAGDIVLALTAGPSSDAGDYSATSLSPSATWSAGGSSGDFGWSYPLRTPPSLNGPAPDLAFAYSAQSVDGRTASTNAQPSWIGEGFDLATSFIERKYVTCKDDGQANKYDLCWKYDNASIVLNGKASELVPTGAPSGGMYTTWRLREDDGSRVEKLTNANANGDADKEYWKVTTTDGTQYFFGQHQLPGWTTGKPFTNSVWTTPVFGDDSGEPCYSLGTGFSTRFCTQAWRWNLDYVVDPNGNAMTYWYTKETNKYAKNGVANPSTSYVRAGYLTRIEYGQRSTTLFATPPMKVDLGTAERCIPGGGETCTTLTSSNKGKWPDVPFDQICTGTTCTDKLAPTFFTRKRLTSVTTWAGSNDVDRWDLTQSFPAPGDGTSPSLWLSSIKHTGIATSTAIPMPAVTFGGTQLVNRVDALEGIAPMIKWRVRTITSETAAVTTVTYAPTECTRAALPAADTNTKRCFPSYWTPDGATEPTLDWFHKYVAAQVLEADLTGGGTTVRTDYAYGGGGAWHYDDDDGITKDSFRTWSGWRGYGSVTVTTGESAAGAPRLESKHVFMRGMHGDKLSGGGTKTVSVTDSLGGTLTDARELAGFTREQITRNGVGGPEVSGAINDPWTHQTASRTQPWGTVKAHFVRTATTRTREPLAAGGTRTSVLTTTFDTTYGLPTEVDDLGNQSTTTDDRCTRYEYARNTGAYIVDTQKRAETVGVNCAATPSRPSDVVSDVRTSYDGLAYGATPTKGNETRSERLLDYVSGNPVYQIVSTTTVDAHGRPTSVTEADPDGGGGPGIAPRTTTAYTPTTGGPLTQTLVSTLDPDGTGVGVPLTTTTTLNPAWGVATRTVDTNLNEVNQTYDALGRTTEVRLPNRTTAQTPNLKFTYAVANDAPTAVSRHSLNADGTTYTVTYTIFDALLRERQTQRPAVGGGRVIVDTSYDSRGLAVRRLADYFNASSPSGTLVAVNAGATPAQTLWTYDGAGRQTGEEFVVNGLSKWTTTTSYNGEQVSVDPPEGGIATTTITDARGRVIERREYDGPAPTGSYIMTTYGYDDADRMTSMSDHDGNDWTWTYDLRGRKDGETDPDKGTVDYAYDDLDRLIRTTDALGRTLANTYDVLGRKTGLYNGTVVPANQLAAWTYDTVTGGKGKPGSAIRYVGGASGAAYTSKVVAYDKLYRATSTQVIIPAVEPSGIAGTFTTSAAYNLDGTLQQTVLPSAGGIAAEPLVYGYNNLSMPTTLTGATGLVRGTTYDELGDPEQYTLGVSSQALQAQITMTYETGTRRLSRIFASDETNPTAPTDRAYSYDAAGNVTKIAETAGTPDDNQCFDYDNHRRLAAAWTPTSADCLAAPIAGGLGGPAPYWLSWTYTAIGLRDLQTQHAAGGDTVTDYTYPAAGAPKPHTLSSTVTTGVGTKTYGYDAVGSTTSKPRAGTGPVQTLGWDVEGRLGTVTEGTNSTSFLYDADGNRLIRRDPGGATTLYLGHTEVHRSGTGVVTGERHYTHNGVVVAVRTNGGLSWLVTDHHGTPHVTIEAATQAFTRRYETPFGGARGTTPPTWPGEKTFVGGVDDKSTALIHLGAREYDPVIGRFLSVDPILMVDDQQSLAAYTYGNNNPLSFSDPTGLIHMSEGGGGGSGGGGGNSNANQQTAKSKCVNVAQCEEGRERRQQVKSQWRCSNRVTCEEKREITQQRRSRWVKAHPPKPEPTETKDCGFFSTCIFTDPGAWVDHAVGSTAWDLAGYAIGAAAVLTPCTALCAGISAGMMAASAANDFSDGDVVGGIINTAGVFTFGSGKLAGAAVRKAGERFSATGLAQATARANYLSAGRTPQLRGKLSWASRYRNAAQRDLLTANQFEGISQAADGVPFVASTANLVYELETEGLHW